MKVTMAVAVLVWLSASPLMAVTTSTEIAVVNSKADFERFWSEAKKQPLPEQRAAFKKNFTQGGYESIFHNVHYSKSLADADFQKTLDEDLNQYLPKLKDSADAIDNTAKEFEAVSDVQRKAFFIFFPESKNLFQQNRVVIYLLPTLGKFAGRVQPVELPIKDSKKRFKIWAVILGMDTIVLNKLDPGVVLTHYLFQTYHQLRNQHSVAGTTPTPLINELWSQGLSTYVGGQFNMGKGDAAVLMDEEMGAICKKEVKNYASGFLQDIKDISGKKPKTDLTEPEIIAKWFEDKPRPAGLKLPTGAGRCLGARVARGLTKQIKLQELAVMDLAKVRPLILNQLKDISGDDKSLPKKSSQHGI